MKQNNADKLDVNGSIGDFYANFTERYIGYNEIEKGLDYLSEVIKTYTVDEVVKSHWVKIFERLLADSKELDKQTKNRMKDKIDIIKR